MLQSLVETLIPWLAGLGLLLALAAGWLMTLFSLPGTWLIVSVAALFAWLGPAWHLPGIGWPVVAALLVLAVFGELVETAAGAMGAARQGASKRAVVLAVIGSIAGSITGALVGLPIPVFGSVVGAILLAGVGAMLGAVLGEEWKGTESPRMWRIGQAAFWGRVLGTLGKVVVASAMVVIALLALAL